VRHLALITCLLVAAPAALVADEPPRPPENPPSFHEWQVWEVKTGRPVALEPWLAGLAAHTIVYVGEEHRNRWHIDAALKILNALTKKGLRPAVALEMFGWDGQDALTRYLSSAPISRDQFLQESRWEESWGGPFEDYEPLVSYAQEHRLTMLALNPPRALVRLVAKQGLRQARKDERMEQWGLRDEVLSDDAAYRSVVLDQIRRCHAELTDDAYRRMYDASLFRDEGMARIIAERGPCSPTWAEGIFSTACRFPIASRAGWGPRAPSARPPSIWRPTSRTGRRPSNSCCRTASPTMSG